MTTANPSRHQHRAPATEQPRMRQPRPTSAGRRRSRSASAAIPTAHADLHDNGAGGLGPPPLPRMSDLSSDPGESRLAGYVSTYRIVAGPGRARVRRHGPRGRQPVRDGGTATVETVLWTPLIALLIFAPIQLAFCGLAIVGARAAADGAARDTAAYTATTQDGQQSAQDRLHHIAGHLLDAPTVTVHRDATTATVTVSGTTPFLFPIPVSWTAQAPVERFTGN